jgi:gluconate 2-dehydrogenase gamma chain
VNDTPTPVRTISRREAVQRITLLLGGAVSAPALAGLLGGCSRPVGDAWTPRVLSSEQGALVLALAEQIIPETDTPGARAARVDQFVDVMLAEYYSEAEREQFLAGLAQVDERARQEHGTRFLDCTPEQQLSMVAALDRDAFAPRPPRPPAEPPEVDVRERTAAGASASPLPPELGPSGVRWKPIEPRKSTRPAVPFYRTLKELTVIGYYTSEVGATRELRYEASPGRYQGCIPFADVGRVWAV